MTTNYIIYIILVVFAMNDPFVTHIVGYQKNILSVLFSNVIFVVSIQKYTVYDTLKIVFCLCSY